MMWMKDTDGNWYCDGPLFTCAQADSGFVWDKNEDGAWFLSKALSSSQVSSFPRSGVYSLAG